MDSCTRRDFLRTAAAATLGGVALPACASLAQKHKADAGPPNVVFILVDQCRFDVLSAAGNAVLDTPNLDRLASEGVLFTQATCATPLCGPSRAAILTGRLLARHGRLLLNEHPPRLIWPGASGFPRRPPRGNR